MTCDDSTDQTIEAKMRCCLPFYLFTDENAAQYLASGKDDDDDDDGLDSRAGVAQLTCAHKLVHIP